MQTGYAGYYSAKKGILIAQAQVQYHNVCKLNEKLDIAKYLMKMPNYPNWKQNLGQEKQFFKKFTLCIDIECVFLKRLDAEDHIEIERIERIKEWKQQFIVFKSSSMEQKNQCVGVECKKPKIGSVCVCKMKVYKIRPYTLEILSAIQPFFEIVAISKMHFNQLKFIIDHLEKLLNQPIEEKNKQTKKDFKKY